MGVVSLNVVDAVPVPDKVTGLPIVVPFTLNVTFPVGLVDEVVVTLTAKVTVVPSFTDDPLVGEVIVIVGVGSVPVPVSAIVLELFTVLSCNTSVALRAPAAEGVNLTASLQL